MKKKRYMLPIVTAVILLITSCGSPQTQKNTSELSNQSTVVETVQKMMDPETEQTSEGLTELETSLDSETSTDFETEEEKEMYLYIGDARVPVTLADNASVKELTAILKQQDIVYTAEDYGGFEKVGEIDAWITPSDEKITTVPGDVILYQGNHICIYYGENSWSFTRLGKIEGYSAEELETILDAGSGSIEVRLSIK